LSEARKINRFLIWLGLKDESPTLKLLRTFPSQEERQNLMAQGHNRTSGDTVRIFRDHEGQWRWRRRAYSGEVTDVSTGTFGSYEAIKKDATEVNPDATIIVTREAEYYMRTSPEE
jgi:hypothetical protein